MHRIKKGRNATEGLKFSSYLVQTVLRIIHKISQNHLVKIKGEKHILFVSNRFDEEIEHAVQPLKEKSY